LYKIQALFSPEPFFEQVIETKTIMNILISDNRNLQQLQQQFSENFPYLKLEFFTRQNRTGNGPARKLIKTQGQTIGQCRTIHNKRQVSISATMTVAELEQQFRENYGLNVQVLRKSGKVWLETTVTNGWTLEQQNKQGESLSQLSVTPKPGDKN
jgi:hypothetical protein